MKEKGYYDSPALSLWQLKNSMWRAARIMIDVGLHTGKLSVSGGIELLCNLASLEPNTAGGEVMRYTTSPTQPSSYMLGRNYIVKLRQNTERNLGTAFDLKAFHEKLLSFSSVSPALIPESAFLA